MVDNKDIIGLCFVHSGLFTDAQSDHLFSAYNSKIQNISIKQKEITKFSALGGS